MPGVKIMKPFVATVALMLSTVAVHGQEPDAATPVQKPKVASGTTEYFDGNGRLIGSVTNIGDVLYFTGPDGEPLGTAERVGDHLVYKTH